MGYIGIGSNLGDRHCNLERSVEMLRSSKDLNVLRASSIYQSTPWGFESKNQFLNAVIEISWDGPPLDLLQLCYRIEAAGGRKRPAEPVPGKYQDRRIDLDLLWLSGVVSSDERLRLPHPLAHKRAFVLVPWIELTPHFHLNGKTLTEWLTELPKEEIDSVVVEKDMHLNLD